MAQGSQPLPRIDGLALASSVPHLLLSFAHLPHSSLHAEHEAAVQLAFLWLAHQPWLALCTCPARERDSDSKLGPPFCPLSRYNATHYNALLCSEGYTGEGVGLGVGWVHAGG